MKSKKAKTAIIIAIGKAKPVAKKGKVTKGGKKAMKVAVCD